MAVNGTENGVVERIRQLERRMDREELRSEDVITLKSDLRGVVREQNRQGEMIDAIRNSQGRNFVVSLLAATAGVVATLTLLLTAGGVS